MLFRTLILRASGLRLVRALVSKSFIFRPMVRRFIAGESLDDAMRVGEELAAQGYFVSLDLLGENVATVAEAERATNEYIEIVRRIAASPHRDRINISIKLTALGLDQGDEVAEANFRRLLSDALPHGIFVRADMEASPYTERTIALIERLFPEFPNTGTVLQAMLHRTCDDMERLISLGCRMRLVKGAYLEGEQVAIQNKATVDKMYVEGAKTLLTRANYPALATHDEQIVQNIEEFAASAGVPSEKFEWQMLYGIRRDLQAGLLAKGYNVRVYVPYGAEWYPYFTRRLAERPANLFFIAKALTKK